MITRNFEVGKESISTENSRDVFLHQLATERQPSMGESRSECPGENSRMTSVEAAEKWGKG